MLAENGHYGHRWAFQRYAGVSARRRIPGRVQHGWKTGPSFRDVFLAEPWPKFVWSDRDASASRERGARRVEPIGAPFLYLLAHRGIAPAPADRSVLALPFHGWEKQQLLGDMEAYARGLEALEREGFGPVTVCLYWIEYDDPAIRAIFTARGYEVITNGNRDGNPEFLDRQLASLEGVAYVTSNRVATASFYALAAGRRFFLWGPPMGIDPQRDPTGEEYDAWQRGAYPALTFEGFGDRCHADVGEDELGAHHVLSVEGLRERFGWDGLRGELGAVALRELWKQRWLRPRLSPTPALLRTGE